ncbi:alpha/beta-hydrolase [Durotheca rogersii]|uniref:alpha/beta-hydrolase n=1 Tax=Durotheca rogersii TaxID=419775 RepID=UPI00221F3A81|nr:alpha/beta-hydrolase [Durotheca rogersii]KAI5862486.1 alpha/beta-hydrolase [Durotheca rogersii]
MDFSRWGQPSGEWLAFAAANPAVLANSDDVPPLTLQKIANGMRSAVAGNLSRATGLSQLVAKRDYVVPTRDGQSITVRCYRPVLLKDRPLPGYVYFHGGGFIFGSLDTELFNCSWLAYSLSIAIVHVCYRPTPQFGGLTAWHDALDGFEWIATHGGTLGIDVSPGLVVGGISAGGSLTACVVQSELRRARDGGAPSRVRGQVLGIPNLIHGDAFPYELFADREKTSMEQCADAAVITKDRMRLFRDLLGRDFDPANRTWSPGLASEDELRGAPKTAFLIAGWDPLRDEGLLYAQKLKNAGVRTKVHIFPGLPHAFNAFTQLPSHLRWNEVLLDCVRWAAADEDGWIVEVPPMLPSATGAAGAAQSLPESATADASKIANSL